MQLQRLLFGLVAESAHVNKVAESAQWIKVSAANGTYPCMLPSLAETITLTGLQIMHSLPNPYAVYLCLVRHRQHLIVYICEFDCIQSGTGMHKAHC